MRDAETAAARLWRDRVEIREHERDEARAQVRIAEQKLAILTAENDRLASENAQLRHQLDQDDTGMQMEAIRTALTPLLTEV
jgi:regulator of replication initiation timing